MRFALERLVPERFAPEDWHEQEQEAKKAAALAKAGIAHLK